MAEEDDEDSQFRPTSSISGYVKDPSVPNLAWDKGKTKFVVDKDEEGAAEDNEDSLYRLPTSRKTDYVEEPFVLNYVWDKGKTEEIKKRNVESAIREEFTPFGPEP